MKVTINQKGMERTQRFHQWIFRSDLQSVEAEAAGVATVLGPKGQTLGQALYSPKSLIALRMMTWGQEKISAGLIAERIRSADGLRRRWDPESTVYRAVFAEADFLPSVIVDRYGEVVVFQTLSAGMETYKEDIIATLKDLYRPRSLVERNDAAIRSKEGLPLIQQIVAGEDLSEVEITIGARRLGLEPLQGQKTGFFLDQRFNAIHAARYLRGRILDAFCYVGQFAIQAAPRAESILCIDSSEDAVARVRKNAELNGLENIETKAANVFDAFKELDEQKARFDGVCVDPPAFVKNRGDLKAALRGYKEINLRAMRLLNPGGILVSSSCSQHLAAEEFDAMLLAAAKDTRRQVQVLERLGQPPDHPTLLAMPETNYLKCAILRVW